VRRWKGILKLVAIVPVALLTMSISVNAQNRRDVPQTSAEVLALHLPQIAGPIPVYYSPGFESRAQHFQSTLETCKAWYEQEVNVHADIIMAVLDRTDWHKATKTPYPMPHSFSTVIIVPASL
jgi:hypothetical protein